ncbi:hypothetical protein ACHAXS_012724 [Conticribra weissflogii]
MSTFQSSTNLQTNTPTTTQKVLSTTSTFQTTFESHPTYGKWWMRNYGLGPNQQVRYLTRQSSPENRYGKVMFRGLSGRMPVAGLSFGPGSFGGGIGVSPGALVVASGPRVSMYGGIRSTGTSSLNRALKGGSAAQKRRDDLDDDEETVDLFGGKLKKGEEEDGDDDVGASKSEPRLDSIDADRQISTGGLLAQCAVHRSDGRLIAIGTEGGTVKICDANSRATLRTFGSAKAFGGGDRKAIRSVSWLRDGKRVVAGGDDGVVRIWNVSGGLNDGVGSGDRSGAGLTFVGHGDSVRAVAVVSFQRDDYHQKSPKGKGVKRVYGKDSGEEGSFGSCWSQLVVSGSYDHTIRVWDIDSNHGGDEIRPEDRCLSVMNHGDPVQALLVLPPVVASYGYQPKKGASKYDNLPLLVSAGGTVLKIWNPLTGTCLGTFPTKHAKTITSLCLLDLPPEDSEEDYQLTDTQSGKSALHHRKRHILTGGLDGLVRIHSATIQDIISGSLPFLHGTQLSEPISSLSISQDMSRLAIGTTTGIVIVHQRRRLVTEEQRQQQQAKLKMEPRHGTYAYFMRGAHEKSHDPDDYLLMHQKKQRLAEYDVLLRKFRYGDALDKVLTTRQPQVVSDSS